MCLFIGVGIDFFESYFVDLGEGTDFFLVGGLGLEGFLGRDFNGVSSSARDSGWTTV